MTTYVVIDWRPYELPEAFGPFDTTTDAENFVRSGFFGVLPPDQDLPDGIDVRELTKPT